MHTGGIILCGGNSTRMGRSKALLPFGEELMLERVARRLGEAVRPLVAVAARGQDLPDLPAEVIVARDTQPQRGPLQGLRDGLAALPTGVDAAYATSCDAPLLRPAFVERLIELLGPHEIAVPIDGKFHHPLAAVYRRSVVGRIDALLAADRLRPVFLFDECDTNEIPVVDLRAVDPDLSSLMNCNRPVDYEAALAAAGLSHN